MSETLCPNVGLHCDDCVADFIAEHPGVEVFRHTAHLLCDCPFVAASDYDYTETVCVACGSRRDLYAEFDRLMDGAPRKAVAA